jgi:hypothetical protein
MAAVLLQLHAYLACRCHGETFGCDVMQANMWAVLPQAVPDSGQQVRLASFLGLFFEVFGCPVHLIRTYP